MDVKIYHKDVGMSFKASLSVIDVIIGIDEEDSENLNAFFCPYCHNQQPLLQYQGKIISITPGHAPIRLPLIKRCSGCKRNYSFNSII
jgi:hypothetical protein